MGRLTVPPKYRDGMKLIASLDQGAIDSALELLKGTESIDASALADSLVDTGLSPADRVRMLESLLSLYFVKEEGNLSPSQIAKDVAEAMAPFLEIEDDAETRGSLERNLGALLDLDELGVKAKMLGLLSSDEKVLYQARIVTDIRPAFGREVEAGPVGMGIVHLLSLNYHTAGAHREVQLSLSPKDLRSLGDALERAEKKESILISSLEDAGIRYLGGDDDD